MNLLQELLTLEGGKAMEEHGVERANSADIKSVIEQLSKILSMDQETLTKSLLGSTTLTLKGKKEDSGDIDVGLLDDQREEAVAAVQAALGVEGRKLGKKIVSFPFPTIDGKKVQVDLVFVPDMRWARFSHFASANSKSKSAVRNELLHSVLKYSRVPGEDLVHHDEEGNLVARASRSYNLEDGLKRIFKHAPKRKDGKGRVKGLQAATPEEVRATFDELGNTGQFKPEEDVILDPDKMAELLFGKGVKGNDLLSTEQIIQLVKDKRPKQADEILTDAASAIRRREFDMPDELKEYDKSSEA